MTGRELLKALQDLPADKIDLDIYLDTMGDCSTGDLASVAVRLRAHYPGAPENIYLEE